MACIRRTLAVAVLVGAFALPSNAQTTSYTYDVHGRLHTVTTPAEGQDKYSTTYNHDNADNRTSVVSTYVDSSPPNPPTGLTATPLAFDQIQLNWTASLDVGGGPVSYYKVYRSGSHVASPAAPPYVDQPLSANTPYTYTVSAVDPSSIESTQSGSASATTPPGPDLTPPSVPTNLQGIAVSGTWINLTWTASQDTPGGSGLAGYEIFRNNGGTPYATSTVASYADQSASPATTYLYQVRAYDVAGNRSGLSNQISVTTLDTELPGAPGNPTFSAIGSSTATATWTVATDNVGVTGYRYSLNGGGSWTNVGNVLTTNLSGLALGTSYTMLVQATDAAGNWGPSGSGSFTTSSFLTDNMSFVGGTTSDGATYSLQGYQSPSLGSLTPNTTSNGKTITVFTGYSDWLFGGAQARLTVTGFSGNPGAGWLQSISVPSLGLTLTGASASFSCGTSSTCSWSWPSWSGNFGGSGTLTIVHQ